MGSDVATRALGDVAEIVMGQSPPGHTYNDDGKGHPLVNGPAQFGARTPIADKWTTAATKLSMEGDIVFCVRGSTTGKMVRADAVYCLGRGVAAIRGQSKHDTDFISAALQARMAHLLRHTTGSTFPNLSSKALAGSEIPWPAERERQVVGEILASLDDRIEHLSERQLRLAGIADQLFAALRESAVRTELLGDWITLDKGTSYSSEELADADSDSARPMINLGNFGRSRLPRWGKLKHYTGSFKERHRAEPGTVVICATDMTSERAVLGKALIVPESVKGAVATHHLLLARQRDNSPFRRYATFLAMNHEPYRRFVAEFANGTTVLSVPKDAIERLPVPVIASDSQTAFVAAVEPLIQSIDASRLEADILQRTRDVLLPQLVTGKVRVKDVDGFLERAGLT